MRSPLETGHWHDFDEVLSTQDLAANGVKEGRGGVYFARNQTLGRGRFGREWISGPGDSLTMSMAFLSYANHPKPYLVGMTVAVAAAGVLHCELAWPNDLVADGGKLGGILTELVLDDQNQRIPIVGIGINLNQQSFPPEIAGIATSLALYNGGHYDPREVAESLVDRLARMPEPSSWAELAPAWDLFDRTPGKHYKTADGSEGVALGIGPEGQLLCSIRGETTAILAADALFGSEVGQE